MRMIYKMAKKELQVLFYSPIAWLLLLCFIVQTAIYFTNASEYFMMGMERNGKGLAISNGIFADGVFDLWFRIADILYLYIPLLTMGVVSREFSSGSVKLLYSSPISNTQIVLGKFFAMATYAFVMMCVLLVYVGICWFAVENFELSWILTGVLGLFLLSCTYMAVGIFISSLTSYQVLAAIGTFIVLIALTLVGKYGQEYDIVRDITYWLSINGRTTTFIDGMICSEDMLYFPVISGLFLALTIIRLHAVRQKQRWFITLAKDLIVLVLVCVVAYVSSRPALRGYCDTTTNKINTIRPGSQEIVNQLDGGMAITCYVNILDPNKNHYMYYPGFTLVNQELFEKYVRFKPEIKLDIIYFYAEIERYRLEGMYNKTSGREQAMKICAGWGLDSTKVKTKEEVDQLANLSEEDYQTTWQIVRENGQKEWLRLYTSAKFPSEAEISASLKRMVMKLPNIGYVTGHGERDIYDGTTQGYSHIGSFKRNQYSVWNQGFKMEEISLERPIPEQVDIVMFADAREPLSLEEEEVLQEYVDRGGNLFILGEPNRREVMNPTLQRIFGMELTPLLAGKSEVTEGKMLANVLSCISTSEAMDALTYYRRGFRMTLPVAAGIEQVAEKGFKVQPLMTCDTVGQFWTELETTEFVDAEVKFNPEVGEVSKQFAVMTALTRKVGDKEQRVLIVGDADCIANHELQLRRPISSANLYLMMGVCDWLSEGRAPIDVTRPYPVDNKYFVTSTGHDILKWTLLWGWPIVVLGLAVYLWLRRKGR